MPFSEIRNKKFLTLKLNIFTTNFNKNITKCFKIPKGRTIIFLPRKYVVSKQYYIYFSSMQLFFEVINNS